MKKFGIALLASALVFSGCELLGKKEDDGGSGGGGGGGGGGGASPGMDLSKMVQAYGPKMIGETAKVGMKVVVESKAGPGGRANQWSVAIVGEEGDNWKVESTQETMAYGKDNLVGMVVEKKTGKILSAVVGKKGEKGKEIKVNNNPPPKAGPAGEKPPVVDCKIALGTFKAYNTDAGGTKTWVGSEGEMEGILLKMESAQGGKELKKKEEVEIDLGGAKAKCVKLAYDNGDEQITTKQEAVLALNGGLVKIAGKQFSTTVKEVLTDAKPALKWE